MNSGAARDFAKLSEDERVVAKRAISTSSREDHREHVNGILNDMEAAATLWKQSGIVKTDTPTLRQTTHAQYQPIQRPQWRPACHIGPTSG